MRKILIIFLMVLSAECCFGVTNYFVATNGNDDTGDGSIGTPWATLDKARTVVQGNTDCIVNIRVGTYYLTSTFTLDADDSGADGLKNIWQAYEDEVVYIKGSKTIAYGDFSVYSGSILTADVTAYSISDPCQVFFNGTRCRRARVPNFNAANPYSSMFPLYPASDTSGDGDNFKYTAGDVSPATWTNVTDIEVDMHGGWWNIWKQVASINSETRTVTLQSALKSTIITGPPNRYYFNNVFEELDAAGEWYLDGIDFYIWPLDTWDAGDVVTIDYTEDLISLDGVDFVTLESLNIGECKGEAITLHDAEDVDVNGCTITNCEEMGVSITDGYRCKVRNSAINNTGHWGVYVTNDISYRKNLTSCAHEISGNTIHNTGWFRKGSTAGAINIWRAVGVTASHNEIYNEPRIGIRVSEGNDNVIEYNYIHEVNRESCDSGGIYALSTFWQQLGNVIQYNYIYDVGGYGWDGDSFETNYQGYAIYLDDFASGYTIYKNIIRPFGDAGILLHGGRHNTITENYISDYITNPAVPIYFSGITNENASLPGMWTQLKQVEESEDGWDGAAYLSAYPWMFDVKEPVCDQNDIMSYNVFTDNVIITNNYDRPVYKVRWLDEPNSVINNNIIYPGTYTKYIYVYGDTTGPKTWAYWTAKGFDIDTNDISVTYDPDPTSLSLYVNTGTIAADYSLANDKTHIDPNGVTHSVSINLSPFEYDIMFEWPRNVYLFAKLFRRNQNE